MGAKDVGWARYKECQRKHYKLGPMQLPKRGSLTPRGSGSHIRLTRGNTRTARSLEPSWTTSRTAATSTLRTVPGRKRSRRDASGRHEEETRSHVVFGQRRVSGAEHRRRARGSRHRILGLWRATRDVPTASPPGSATLGRLCGSCHAHAFSARQRRSPPTRRVGVGRPTAPETRQQPLGFGRPNDGTCPDAPRPRQHRSQHNH